MCWFVVDDEFSKLETVTTPDKFTEIYAKEILSQEDVEWLYENDLIDLMTVAKGGSLKATLTIDPVAWKGLIGSSKAVL